MSRGRVLVTPRSMSVVDAPGIRQLIDAGYDVVVPSPGRQPTVDELIAALPGAIGWVAGVEPIGAEVLRHADQLRVISRNGVGSDGIEHSVADAAGVRVLTARGANARGVAELALGLMICGLRGIPAASASVRVGRWERTTGREMAGRTLGIVGYGAIGRALAGFASGLGMVVLAHDPFLDEVDVPLLPLEEVLRRSDVVSLHVPPSPDGPLLDSSRLALIRDDAVVINTARSALVDEAAMLAELEDGRFVLYCVDAFDVEPPPRSALLDHPRVLPTPHLGAATFESSRRAAEAAVGNLLAALQG